ncbi:nicotinate-nucleotide--dimethylbenzimidazole phosphoribosyltransferase [Prochlorococcus sp. MIT 1300]|uniref:nicotinate-nucleotide--dimethylbenzimidazole phosphoribosyltransferase n=1 Tax=Prochlorococcus sp. MIT 1300 TaxID=3096218 RepID=UPI002A756894|nr:nicotinate-nucleotide--dimethylbenzimidazole phosphoribosyltransferase [Prochlorococcus sp. MIT 1300]
MKQSVSFKIGSQDFSAFGDSADPVVLNRWLEAWVDQAKSTNFVLVLAGSKTSEIEGISSAGATGLSRRYTALADAEFVLKGPGFKSQYPLPSLKAGFSPALITYVAACSLGLVPLVLVVGILGNARFPHLLFEPPSLGPANCLSSGKAMPLNRVERLWDRGFAMGRKLKGNLVLAECVPGGTTTAQAVLTGLGICVSDLISGSGKTPPLKLKKELVEIGLRSASLGPNPLPKELIAAVGDPFQAAAVGLLLGARSAEKPVLLGGGSQMLAVLAIALATLKPSRRKKFLDGVSIGTTAWLMNESLQSGSRASSLGALMNRVEEHFGVSLLGLASGLRFHMSNHQCLRDYELGYVKEGVGAGALALLAQLHGKSCEDLVKACDFGVETYMKTVSEGISPSDK